MTLPAIVQNYQKTALKSQFKKVYSTAENAYKMAEAQLGFQPECYYGVNSSETDSPNSDCAVLKEQLKKTYKVIKVCEGHALRDGCIPAYKGRDNVYAENNPDLNDDAINSAMAGCNWTQSQIYNNQTAWNLADGTIILWYSGKMFAIDINGMKSPNKWGYDLFIFSFYKDKNGALKVKPSEGGCTIIEKGGVSTLQMLKDVYK